MARDDLEARIEELEGTLREVRDDLRDPPRGPLGLPRPPTPREALRFADEYAIPAAIAILEANLRTLELLQGALRTARRGEDSRERVEGIGREAADRIEAALADLQEALQASDLPSDPEARELLAEARELNAELREELETIDGGEAAGDVDEELESIREEVGDT
ncbi:MAG: hypothetical protein ABEI39_06160 [Halobacteriales archaeon]